MPDQATQTEQETAPIPRRALDWTMRVWRPAGTVVAIALALLLTWHVVNGKNGLTVWHKKRTEDRQLRRDIDDLQKENARLRDRIGKLQNDTDAIEHEAREKLHYAKTGEVIVIYPLPEQPQPQAAPASSAK